MVPKWIGVIAVAVLASALAVGCGGESKASSETTKAEFVKEAESICAPAKKERLAATDRFQKEEADHSDFQKEREDAERLMMDFFVPSWNRELEALEGLEVPANGEEAIEEFLESFAQGIEIYEERGLDRLTADDPFKPFETEAKDYGLICIT